MPSRLRHRTDALDITSLPAAAGPDVEPATLLSWPRSCERARCSASTTHPTPPQTSHYVHGGSSRTMSSIAAALVPVRLGSGPRRLAHVPRRPDLPANLERTAVRASARTRRRRSIVRRRPLQGVPQDGDIWPCQGRVVLHAAAATLAPYVRDGVLEVLAPDLCRLSAGAWLWTSLAADFCRFDVDIVVLEPPALREGFAAISRHSADAATPNNAAGHPN